MTDHKFTDDELEKTLHICSHYAGYCSDYCPLRYDDECVQTMARHALALINRQKVEIERLQAVHADMTESLRLATEANKDMQAEIEKLKERNDESQNT